MKQVARIPLRVVFYRDEADKSLWVAHCLELDLIGHGETQADAIQPLSEAIALQLENSLRSKNLNNLFTQAPAEYQMMYARGRNVAKGELKIEVHYDDVEIDRIDYREYDDGYADAGADSRLAMV